MFAHFFDHLTKQLRRNTSLRTISFDMRRLNTGNYRYPALFIEVPNASFQSVNPYFSLQMTLVTAPLPTSSWATPGNKSGNQNSTAGPDPQLGRLTVVGEILQAMEYFQSNDWLQTARQEWEDAVHADATAGARLGAFVKGDTLLYSMSELPISQQRRLGAWGAVFGGTGTFQLPPLTGLSSARFVQFTDVNAGPPPKYNVSPLN